MTVIIKTTKGKNERMEFAATEKAKVWTSVRVRYWTVDRTRPGRRTRDGAGLSAEAVSDPGTAGLGLMTTGRVIVAEEGVCVINLSSISWLPPYFLISVKVIQYDRGSYYAVILISLA
jgi:hypothetical protein